MIPAKDDHSAPVKDYSISAKNYSIPAKDYSKISHENAKITDFCNDILQKLDDKANIHPFYEYDK